MRFFVILLIFSSCVSDPSKQARNAYLLEEEDKTLSEVIEDISILLDLYPINGEIDKENLSYELQRPRQSFSSGSNNEIRLHKLGQIRWLYVESLPSSVWPILNQYIENEDNLSIRTSDPDEGLIETDIFNRKDKEVKEKHEGFFVSSNLFINRQNRKCEACNCFSLEKTDTLYLNKYSCCQKCYIQYVEDREERWLSGWRPDEVTEDVDT